MKRLLITCTDMMAAQFMLHHVRALSQEGVDVELACSPVGGRMNFLREKIGDIAAIHEVNLSRSPFRLSNVVGYKELKQIIETGGYDTVWTNEPVMGMATRLAARRARTRGVKVIYMSHGFHFYKGAPLFNRVVYGAAEKLMSRHCDLIITINREDEAYARAHYQVPVGYIQGIGADDSRFGPLSPEERRTRRQAAGYREDDRLILCVGELTANKNQAAILAAMPAILRKCPGAQLLLAGKGVLEESLRHESQRLGIGDSVDFLGYRTNLEEIVPIADVVVSASIREGLPQSIVEAMLCARPVVVSDNRGHRDLVTDGENGFVFRIGSLEDLAASVLKILVDRELGERLGRCGERKARRFAAGQVEKELYPLLSWRDK